MGEAAAVRARHCQEQSDGRRAERLHPTRHCEERSDEAIPLGVPGFSRGIASAGQAGLAMTGGWKALHGRQDGRAGGRMVARNDGLLRRASWTSDETGRLCRRDGVVSDAP